MYSQLLILRHIFLSEIFCLDLIFILQAGDIQIVMLSVLSSPAERTHMAYAKKYEQLDYTDYFMFGKINEDPALCRDTLRCLLGLLFDYIKSGAVSDDLTLRISKALDKARMNYVWRTEYMKERVLFMDMKEEAERLGHEEGLAEGRAEGRAEGQNRINKLNSILISLNRTDDMIRSVNDPDYQEKLFTEFNL